MTDARLSELLLTVAGNELRDIFARINAMSGEQLDALAEEQHLDWWRTEWTTEHKRAKAMHSVYLIDALVKALPEVLAEDGEMKPLGQDTAEALVGAFASCELAEIYTRIDSLPEGLLDILAQDFLVQWWNINADAETKRKTFKGVWDVYRHLGTPAAVDTAVAASFENASISEWFEYNGKPYHFRISVDLGERFPSNDTFSDEITRGLNFYKNVRSALDSIEYVTTQNAPIFAGIATAITESMEYLVPDELADAVLVDENENILTDENGGVLVL